VILENIQLYNIFCQFRIPRYPQDGRAQAEACVNAELLKSSGEGGRVIQAIRVLALCFSCAKTK